ncbi:MAG: GNAT family N-acetyltransferase [Betaproteobacteria bacterium RBG_16_64_9]|nr:MAG: GNAT family N-acetyltransferase [Betaproteobacteria bacterium RBG_16_64_9]
MHARHASALAFFSSSDAARFRGRLMGDDSVTLRVAESIAAIDPAEWNALAGDHPFLCHEFFHALHETGCATPRTGWAAQFLTLWRDGRLAGALPLYLKSHSRGEYVFDWAWADAYHRHGLDYYPKFLAAVPFSPVTGPRVLAPDAATRLQLATAALELARSASSLHILFPVPEQAAELERLGMMIRRGLQFHWHNEGYRSFDDFLAQLAHEKRKKIRQERRKVGESGIHFRRLVGKDIQPEHWKFFIRCYNGTYRAHHSTPYLNLAFFQRLGEQLPQNVLLVLAEVDGRPLATALNIFCSDVLYGRYWGSVRYVPNLHFETCYYQAIEFCIERGIRVFEGGAQGEHKLARGFHPVQTCSAHWLKHPAFADAVEKFLDREAAGVERYIDELSERSPFRKAGP